MKLKEFFKKFFSNKTAVILTASVTTVIAIGVLSALIVYGNPKKSETEESGRTSETQSEDVVSQDEEWESEETTAPEVPVHSYKIMINRAMNCLTIYLLDENNEYIPYKAMICSTGLGGSNSTPAGTFSITGKAAWCLMVGDSYTQYACRINGPIMIHSIPYVAMDRSTLHYNKFNHWAAKLL
jgi:hypothetical protein